LQRGLVEDIEAGVMLKNIVKKKSAEKDKKRFRVGEAAVEVRKVALHAAEEQVAEKILLCVLIPV
jgi:hypothetical protein